MDKEIYTKDDIKIMNAAEDGKMPQGSRVEELISFSKAMGLKKIGIAHCGMFTKEAKILHDTLAEHFEVVSVGCKTGGIAAKDLLGREVNGISCNPAGQAAYLSENKTEMNISMGLCMGHDIVFNSKSDVMTTSILVKDRKHKHNPMKNFE